MFGRGSSNALELTLGKETVLFSSPGDFAFALDGRTDVPGPRADALLALDDDALQGEAVTLSAQQQEFGAVLGAFAGDASSIRQFLRQVEPDAVTRDHDWRCILGALGDLGETHGAYVQVALEKYVQYLTARRETVAAIQAARLQPGGTRQSGEDRSADTAQMGTAGLDEHPGA
jgi:hypothetical protein